MLLVQAVVYGNIVYTSSFDESLEVGDSVLVGKGLGQKAIELSLWVKEIIIRINDYNCCVTCRHDGDCRLWQYF